MDINKKIEELVENNNVYLFMKGTPEVPQCGFSLAVANVLKHLNVKFESINVLEKCPVKIEKLWQGNTHQKFSEA